MHNILKITHINFYPPHIDIYIYLFIFFEEDIHIHKFLEFLTITMLCSVGINYLQKIASDSMTAEIKKKKQKKNW